jgi:hypothetical protein
VTERALSEFLFADAIVLGVLIMERLSSRF